MTSRYAFVSVLLGLTLLSIVLCLLGLCRSRDVYGRLHFLGPLSVLAPVLLAAAVLIDGGPSGEGVKAIVIAAVLFVYGPLVSHATAKACRRRREPNG